MKHMQSTGGPIESKGSQFPKPSSYGFGMSLPVQEQKSVFTPTQTTTSDTIAMKKKTCCGGMK